LVVLVVLAVAVVATPSDSNARVEFEQWMSRFSKTYTTSEAYDHAFENFKATIDRVSVLNAESALTGGRNPARFALGMFADLSPLEFKARYLTLDVDSIPKPQPQNILTKKVGGFGGAGNVDWRDSGAVTAVKDQGQCGSCWAFSVTETVESAFAIQRNTTPPVLAPEQLVDCDKTAWGCDGGIADYAWKDVVRQGGIMAEADYPYTAGKTGHAGTCKFSTGKIVAPVSKYTWVGTPCQYVGDTCDDQDDSLVVDALTNQGPLAICVNADWQDYSSGVFSRSCPHEAADMNHAVQLVGYNNDQKYWIVRNSWSATWGESGYIYIKQGSNLCGVANIVSFPTTI